MRISRAYSSNEGLYTVEGALTITVFTALFMVLMSVMSIIQTKSFIQEALNETAMELSQYAYSYISDSDLSETVSISACRLGVNSKLTKNRDDADEWLKNNGVIGGLSSIDFSGSRLLESDKYIDIEARYCLKINAFGLLNKTIQISQRAKTTAWLPYDYGGQTDSDSRGSIWFESPLVRGKYFVRLIKDEQLRYAVAGGQGIDLYDESSGLVSVIYSMNLFASSYSESDFVPLRENIISQIEEYAIDLEEFIEKLTGTMSMEDGSVVPVKDSLKKQMILIVPEEAQGSIYDTVLNSAASVINGTCDIDLTVRYIERALCRDG